MLACSNTATVGRTGDAQLPDAAQDAPTDAPDDAAADSSDASDAGTDTDTSDAGTDCARPWVLMISNLGDAAQVVRFSLVGEPTRCADLTAEGMIPPTTVDVEALNEDVIFVIGPDAVVAIDVASDTVLFRNDGVDAPDAQAFALRSDPPWMGVAWFSDIGRITQYTGVSITGEEQVWSAPAMMVGVSAHRDPRYAYGLSFDNEWSVFNPFNGMEIESVDGLRLYKPTVVGDPPRVAGGGASGGLESVRTGLFGEPLTTRLIDGCVPQEAVPHPLNPDQVIVRCGREGTTAVLADVIADESRVLIGPDASEPTRTIQGLGILE